MCHFVSGEIGKNCFWVKTETLFFKKKTISGV